MATVGFERRSIRASMIVSVAKLMLGSQTETRGSHPSKVTLHQIFALMVLAAGAFPH